MKIAPIFDPEKRKATPQAAQVNLHIIFLIGTILWAIAAAVFGILEWLRGGFNHYFLVCIWGIIFGVAGLIWEQYNRHIYRLVALMQQN